MQGTWIWSLILGTFHKCCGKTKPVCHNYWACVLWLLKFTYPRAYDLQQEKPPQQEALTPKLESNPHLLQLEKSSHTAVKVQYSHKKISTIFKKRKTHPKSHVRSQGTPKFKNNFEKEQSWTAHTFSFQNLLQSHSKLKCATQQSDEKQKVPNLEGRS